MMVLAKQANVDAVKFQLYDVINLLGPTHPELVPLVLPTQLTRQQADDLVRFGKSIALPVFFSVFDHERLGWVRDMGVTAVKLGSRSWDDIVLVNSVLLSDWVERVIQSVPYGKFNHNQYAARCDAALEHGIDYELMYCVPIYPTKPHQANIRTVDFDKIFSGYSDHLEGIAGCILAATLPGVTMIEKHFTLCKLSSGPDHIVSCEPYELRNMVRMIRDLEEIS